MIIQRKKNIMKNDNFQGLENMLEKIIKKIPNYIIKIKDEVKMIEDIIEKKEKEKLYI